MEQIGSTIQKKVSERTYFAFVCLRFAFFIFCAVFISINKNQNESQLIKRQEGIIFGALNEQSIAWKVAERAGGGSNHNVVEYSGCRTDGRYKQARRKTQC